MTTAAPSTALATIKPVFTDPERLALAGFLAGYRAAELAKRPAGAAGHLPPARRVRPASAAWRRRRSMARPGAGARAQTAATAGSSCRDDRPRAQPAGRAAE